MRAPRAAAGHGRPHAGARREREMIAFMFCFELVSSSGLVAVLGFVDDRSWLVIAFGIFTDLYFVDRFFWFVFL